ncbi:MAG TPA: hypothetical protein VGQ57_06010 [Polyangiaceae bacterium]|nr:hypothetical protein [Polyangiaceae bacterium]
MEARTASERAKARRHALYWVVAALALVLAAFAVLRRGLSATSNGASAVADPLSLVPPGPAFVLTVDVMRLRASPFGAELLGKGLERLNPRGAEGAVRSCQSLLGGLERLAVSMPAGDAANAPAAASFGVVGAGHFSKTAVLDCARATAGGRDAVPTTIGSFDTLRVPEKSGELAARDGLFVVSDGDYFRALLDRAEGHPGRASAGSAARDGLHAELRRVIGQSAPIVATLTLEPGWLSRMAGDPEADRSPLAALRAAALRANVTRELELSGMLATTSDDDAARVERFFTNLKSDLGPLATTGALGLLSKVALVRHGSELDFSGKLSLADLETLAPPAAPAPSR